MGTSISSNGLGTVRQKKVGPQSGPRRVVCLAILGAAALISPASRAAGSSTSFIENRGQLDATAKYFALGPGACVYFTSEAVIVDLRGPDRGWAVWIRFTEADSDPVIEAREPLPTRLHYFLGNDPAAWQTDVPVFAEITYRDLWPGVDLRWHEEDGVLTYEILSGASTRTHEGPGAGAEPAAVRFTVDGAREVRDVDPSTEWIETDLGRLVHERPGPGSALGRLYLSRDPAGSPGENETSDGAHRDAYAPPDPGGFGDGTRLPLLWSTFLGGINNEHAQAVALDGDGTPVVAGYTNSLDFPTTPGGYDITYNFAFDAFVAKLDATGSVMLWGTFLGGEYDDGVWGIILDSADQPLVIGHTSSATFPTTVGAYDPTHNGGADVFVTMLNSAGSALVYSTFLGGSGDDVGYAIAPHGAQGVVVAGRTSSSNFPASPGAYDPSYNNGEDAFVAELEGSGSSLAWCTYLGGWNDDEARAVAVTPGDFVVVAGTTASPWFPVTGGAYDDTFNGVTDAFVSSIGYDGHVLFYSTFLGGAGQDAAHAIRIHPYASPSNPVGRALVTGETGSADFPTTTGAFDQSYNGGTADAFLLQFGSSANTLSWSTFLGSEGSDAGRAVAFDAWRRPVVVGSCWGADFPTTANAFDTSYNGGPDGFVTAFSMECDALRYSTFLGSVGIDNIYALALRPNCDAVVVGSTTSMGFPTTAGAFDPSFNGLYDAFAAELDLPRPPRAWRIRPDGLGDAPTIQAGLDSAWAQDSVVVACGTYYEHNIAMKAGVWLTSETGQPDCVTIDAQQQGRVLYCLGPCSSTRIEGFTFTGGAMQLGGGLYFQHADLHFGRCVISGNMAETEGGGIFLNECSPNIYDCEIRDNQSGSHGGGISCHGSSPMVSDCLLSGNTAAGQGAGGGIFCALSSSPRFYSCVFTDNTAASYGGGLFCLSSSSPLVSRCTFHANAAPTGGAMGCTIGSHPVVDRTILAFSSLGEAVACGTDATASLNCCDVYGNAGGDWVGCIADQYGIDGNFSADPMFVGPEHENFRIVRCSPCAAANSPAGCNTIGAGYELHDEPRVWVLQPDGTGDAPTIQAALDRSCPGDTLALADGTYLEHDIVLESGITILGQSGQADLAIIDAQGQGRVFYCDGVDNTTFIETLTLTGGSAEYGAGIYCRDSAPSITGCVLSGNRAAEQGGGIYCDNSFPTVARCTFCEDSAGTSGGGICLSQGSVATVERTIIAFGLGGAAVYCTASGGATLACCDLYGNAGGDWVGCVAGQSGVNGNICEDPLFCDREGGNLRLFEGSPCAQGCAPPGCISIGALPAGCHAPRVWHIRPDGSGDAPTIAAGLDSAQAGDTVLIACGTYHEYNLRMKEGVTVRGQTGEPECVTIDAELRGRVFSCQGLTQESIIEGLTLANGRASGFWHTDGGGMLCRQSDGLRVRRCRFTGNSAAEDGGALHCASSAASFSECAFDGNRAASWGGAIYCSASAPNLSLCLISGNEADFGGGIAGTDAIQLVVNACTLAENTASRGGGVYLAGQARLTLTNTIIAFSTAGGSLRTAGSETCAPTCCDIYGNTGGDWIGMLEPYFGTHGNIAEDPLFCGQANPAEPYSLEDQSPCAAQNNPTCGQIGALPVGCGLSDTPEPTALPTTWRLHGGCPNPFNGVTALRFDLPEPAKVTLRVVDPAGRTVRRLLAEAWMEAGRRAVAWDGRDDAGQRLNAGFYFCCLKAGQRTESRRVVLLR